MTAFFANQVQWLDFADLFETNIHSRSYSHIIRNIYNVPKDVFNTIHDTQEIVGMASSVGKYYDELHRMNCKKELGFDLVSDHEHIKAIYLALHASYALEAFRFMVSFATSLAMVENKIFIGNGNIIQLILQDEILHKDWTAFLINYFIYFSLIFSISLQILKHFYPFGIHILWIGLEV